jgi:hypothetical protein
LKSPVAKGCSPYSVRLNRRAFALRKRKESILALDRDDDFQQIPFAAGIMERLHFCEIHIAHNPAVPPNAPVLGHKVVDRQSFHFSHDRFRLICTGALNDFR